MRTALLVAVVCTLSCLHVVTVEAPHRPSSLQVSLLFSTSTAKPFGPPLRGEGQAHDCRSHMKAGNKASGVYPIEIEGKLTHVPCDQETRDGGWTTIMRYSHTTLQYAGNYSMQATVCFVILQACKGYQKTVRPRIVSPRISLPPITPPP